VKPRFHGTRRRIEARKEVPPTPSENSEILFARRVACAIIECAVLDAQNNHEDNSPSKRIQHERDQISAIRFFRGPFFQYVCDTLDLPADKIKTQALL
jgi:hypothetical protein